MLVPSATAKPFNLENLVLAQTTNFSNQAQTFSLETIWRYAAALQEINPIREKTNVKIDTILGPNRPPRVCYHSDIPEEVKQSCDLFGSQMVGILNKHQVTDVYNAISIQVQSDESLEKKIKKAGVCQQRGISLANCF